MKYMRHIRYLTVHDLYEYKCVITLLKIETRQMYKFHVIQIGMSQNI